MEKPFELNLLQNECLPNGSSILKVDICLLEKANKTLWAVTHPLRCKMLQLIHQETFISVGELYLKMGLEQTVVSRHLAILRKCGFVFTQRQGKNIYYTVNYERLQEIGVFVKRLVKK